MLTYTNYIAITWFKKTLFLFVAWSEAQMRGRKVLSFTFQTNSTNPV